MSESNEKLLEVKNLRVDFRVKGGLFTAVKDVNFFIRKGETFGLVGESGSGKTTIGRAIVRIAQTSAGEILFRGRKINGKIPKELDAQVVQKIQMIFQDPMASLNERAKVDYIVSEGIINSGKHKSGKYKDEAERMGLVQKALLEVGLLPEFASRFPHEFSGGQRQRIGIARAICLNPKLIVCDEPMSALDVSIQAQIINLLEDLQDRLGLTYLFIAHNLSVVKHIADRVAVMYLGRIVELASTETVFGTSAHPYTEALLSAVPVADTRVERTRLILRGDVPSPSNPPPGCHFHTRCPYAIPMCRETEPKLSDIGGDHLVSCHLRGPRTA